MLFPTLLFSRFTSDNIMPVHKQNWNTALADIKKDFPVGKPCTGRKHGCTEPEQPNLQQFQRVMRS